jgi:hypothetical protein
MEHRRRIVPHLGLPVLIIAVLLAFQIFSPAPQSARTLTASPSTSANPPPHVAIRFMSPSFAFRCAVASRTRPAV